VGEEKAAAGGTGASEDEPRQPSRRRLLGWLSRGFLSLWAVGLGWMVAAFLKPPRSRESLGERVIKVGPEVDLLPGQARLVRHGREPLFVVRTEAGELIGLSAVCTHLHCVLDWDRDRNQLACPCHEGAFDLNGNVLTGPPPRPLRRYRVETRLGQLYLHL
jgi:cytochrome b6-f complex iron-sulfur subunit